MPDAYINRIETAVPPNDVQDTMLRFARSQLRDDPRRQAIFSRMAERSGIEHRFSCLRPVDDPDSEALDEGGLFRRGAFPGTGTRMGLFEAHAPALALEAIGKLDLGADLKSVTHLIVASCTGFSAPGIDLEIVARCGLLPSVERTMIGFMGCYAAINALKLARHIVRSEPDAKVLCVNIELCTLHLKETTDLERLLTFCLWGDGCAASLVTAEPGGLRLDRFKALLAADARDLMTWSVRDDGFDMVLSGRVPKAIDGVLRHEAGAVLNGRRPDEIDLWAVHPGGRSVLDAVSDALDLPADALEASRAVLRENGNMSSATVMFVLERMLREPKGLIGSAMAFGPGLTAETMLFETAG
ncbi:MULTISPECIES: type III polyketide synthase [unclassified Aureimonas]|uniref:type III polyketide synthase n=1 Tax=unclassified Aureimonas TaxID=2615206 RepID=UPI0006FADAE6|nr:MULTISPECIES: type III polyketide synthase [unclassified Aureimonas]KQT62040.1 stilbene synthase [Aureimonas sp. Leaf460]KQT69571.1 stilbene synthase [Aureimonas sp. Leaf427]